METPGPIKMENRKTERRGEMSAIFVCRDSIHHSREYNITVLWPPLTLARTEKKKETDNHHKQF